MTRDRRGRRSLHPRAGSVPSASTGGREAPMPTRTAVLGAGALGLTAALRLAQHGNQVTVLEREPLPGGLAAGFRVGGEDGPWLEKFYHHLFRSDRHAIGLIRELGLEADLTWHRVPTVTMRDGKPWQLDSPTSLLRFQPLPVVDRFRMGAALAYLRALPSPGPLEGRTAVGWIRRWMGRASFDVVWGPLLSGKFGASAETIAMPWFWARVHDRTPELGYLTGGFQRLYQALADAVVRHGGEVALGREVTEITPDGDGLAVTPPCRGRWRRDHRAVRPGRQHPCHSADLSPDAGTPGRLSAPIRMGPGVRRPLPGPGAGSAVDERVLDERQRSGLPVHGARGAHQHARARGVRRAPPGLPGQLPPHGRSVAQGVQGRSARRFPARPRPHQLRRSSAPG